MLDVSQLCRSYGDFKAVDNVSFQIGNGEIVGLLGHNGAGKTTIMKMLSGYLEPNHGSISINGMDMQSQSKQLQQQLGYLPESLPIYPEMSVIDYLDYSAELKGLTKNDKTKEIRKAVAATELATKLTAPINELSRGYKQRVGVAQAIIGQPQLLILDEPTNGLDPTQTEHMRHLIRQIAENATVILSTHIMQEVDALCDRALIIRDGELVVDRQLSELRQSNNINLVTSLSAEQTNHSLQKISGIDSINWLQTDADDSHKYRVTIKDNENLTHISADIVAAIVSKQGKLFAINEEQHDLETLFRKVNAGVSHAA